MLLLCWSSSSFCLRAPILLVSASTIFSLSSSWTSLLLPSHRQKYLFISHPSPRQSPSHLFLTLPIFWQRQKYILRPDPLLGFWLHCPVTFGHFCECPSSISNSAHVCNTKLLFCFPCTVLLFLLYINEWMAVYPGPNHGGQSYLFSFLHNHLQTLVEIRDWVRSMFLIDAPSILLLSCLHSHCLCSG